MLDIKTLAKEIRENNAEKGWEAAGSERFMAVMMLIVSEVSEAVEEFRDGHDLNKVYFRAPDAPKGFDVSTYQDSYFTKPEGVPIEMADTIIRILDWCEANRVDIEDALLRKMEYNKSRSFRHGGKRV
jgi:NTP pyrophosphatase (non-canonical NTP hydrolase)